MWIVRLALIRPYTFIVMSLLILVLGIFSILTTATDIFPEINIPVVSVLWSYDGISAEEMEGRIATVCERVYTSQVNDIEHIESQSYKGVTVIRIYFQPNAKIEASVAQLAAISSTIVRRLPPGITPPAIIRYNATAVPVLQIGASSETLSEDQVNDYANNFLRNGLATVQGATVLPPSGGKNRQVTVDIDPNLLYAKGLSALDVSSAISAQNLILPAGTAKMGEREYDIRLNSSPALAEELNNLPIKQSNGATVYMRDIGHVRYGSAVQTNIVRKDGKRGIVISILKNGGASTLSTVERMKLAIPKVVATLPTTALDVVTLFDQSLFVKASINGVLREGVIAALLTGLMILIFLGSWRSTIIIATSIPLSILCSIVVLSLMGETLNIMTLGGLSLAVGILVDDATVELENIHRNLAQKKSILKAILDGASQIATPALVSTLCICIVFVPVFLLSGVAKFLFSPLALAVIFAMLASYLLSRTLVPTMVRYMLAGEIHLYAEEEETEHTDKPIKSKGDWVWRMHLRFDRGFEKFRAGYANVLAWVLSHKAVVSIGFALFVAISFALFPFIGRDFFPTVDAGQLRLHVRAPTGTRIEETELLFGKVENIIRQVIPKEELNIQLDNIGQPFFSIVYGDNTTIGSFDGEILIALKENHKPSQEYAREITRRVKEELPGLVLYYQPADIVTQILNFGLPSPLDIQVVGRDKQGTYKIAQQIAEEVRKVKGSTDVHLNQVMNLPQIRVDVDRTRASEIGLTQQNVASDLLVSLSSSGQTSPNFWLDPRVNVSYTVAVQTPQYRISSVEDLLNTPITAPGTGKISLLSNISRVSRGVTQANVSHYNAQPVMDVLVNVDRRDLGGVATDVEKIVKRYREKLPRGTTIDIRGQVTSMNTSFAGLAGGLVFAIVLVYFLMVINFQSWVDPLIIIAALPGAISGILWMLFATQTTISVPSLMGAIMCIGVATSNSILMVTFANDQRAAGMDAMQAALSAGFVRIRPVLMTALAMIVGMLPMSLGLGEGGEQNAPLGRAVIGGLLVATFTTLFFVPLVYSALRKAAPAPEIVLPE